MDSVFWNPPRFLFALDSAPSRSVSNGRSFTLIPNINCKSKLGYSEVISEPATRSVDDDANNEMGSKYIRRVVAYASRIQISQNQQTGKYE